MKKGSKRNVPEEIRLEVLYKLPVKSLVRFRSVCKSWWRIIDDPKFARLHLVRFKNNVEGSHIFTVQGPMISDEVDSCVVKSRTTFRSTSIIRDFDRHFRNSFILSSVDGMLLLIERSTMDLTLCNPSIRKTLLLSPQFSEMSGYFDFGLGFDPWIQDYKVVRFVLDYYDKLLWVAIFTVGTNSWKSIDDCANWSQDFITYPPIGLGQRSVCVNGVLYALVKDESQNVQKLVSFDLKTELFGSAALPVSTVVGKIATIDDSLAMINLADENSSIWILENLGNDIESSRWTLRCTFAPLQFNIWLQIGFVCLPKNELLSSGYNGLITINLETNEQKMVLKKNLYMDYTWPYVESLLLLHSVSDDISYDRSFFIEYI